MSTIASKGRSRVAVVAVLALVLSVFAFAAPASAATGDVEAKADFSACVAGATADAGFSDVAAADFFNAAVDCVKYYGITAGTTATTYSPADVVTRGQMAVFLTKIAALGGVTMPDGSDQGFTDIAGEIAVFQTAINQAKQLGITAGTSATTYGPTEPVTRWQMAIFIQKTASLIEVGPGGSDSADSGTTIDAAGTSASGFTDLGAVTAAASDAIEDIYDLGITAGTTATTYGPFVNVTRGQMAVFLTKLLGHTNVKPAGVTVQADPTSDFGGFSPDVVISYRDSSFKPAANVLIDVFSKTVDTGTTLAAPLNAAGNCDGTQTGDCTIALSDLATNSQGNVLLSPAVADGKTTQWWAWTGTTGAVFDSDTVTPGTVTVTSNAGAVAFLVTTTIPDESQIGTDGNLVKYGTAVTHTFQLVDADGDPVADAKVDVVLVLNTWVDGVQTGASTSSQETDATGKVTVSIPAMSDPDTVAPGDDNQSKVLISVLDTDGLPLDLSELPNGDYDVNWDDDASVATTTTISSAVDYVKVSSTGTGSNSVTAGVWDQYGLGMNNQSVTFTSNVAASSTIDGLVRTTGTDGKVTQGYTWDGGADIETVTATHAVAGADSDDVAWASAGVAGPIGAQTLLVGDIATDTIVIDNGGAPVAYTYDSNDQFNSPAGTPVSFSAFETELDAAAVLTAVTGTYTTTASSISSFSLG